MHMTLFVYSFSRNVEQLSSDPDVHKVVTSFNEAIDFSLAPENRELFEAVWVMGGQRVFEVSFHFLVCLFVVLSPAEKYFTHIEACPLSVKC